MYKFCKLCGSSLNLEDFEPKSDIYQIMEKENLCFKCAFWTWRKREDQYLVKINDKDFWFNEVTREECILDEDEGDDWLISQLWEKEGKEKAKPLIIQKYYRPWFYGRPIIINNEHWIFHYGSDKRSRYLNRYNSLLLDDGTIIPAMLSSSISGGLTHQGNIPEKFMGYPLILEDIPLPEDCLLHDDPDENVFYPNAIYLTQEDEEYIQSLIEVDYKTKPYHFTEGLVPEKFVKRLFKKFYNQ